MKALLLLVLMSVGCRSAMRVEEHYVDDDLYVAPAEETPIDRGTTEFREEAPPPTANLPAPQREPAPANGELVSCAASVPPGRIAGQPRDQQEFRRGGAACTCRERMDSCKCLHCLAEPGSECYCDQGEPKCLCGIDMGGCRCGHCAGREGVGVCPCDHSKTREMLRRRGK